MKREFLDEETYIVLISASYHSARRICEKIEGDLFIPPEDFDGIALTYIKDMLKKYYPDMSHYIMVVSISDFMDMQNDQDIDMGKFFMTHVSYKRYNDLKDGEMEILKEIKEYISIYLNKLGRGDMDDTQCKEFQFNRIKQLINILNDLQ